MKRKIYTYLSVGIMLLSSLTFNKANAQNQEYWRENFDGTGPTGDPGTSTTVVDYAGNSGFWKFYAVWLTTGTACNNSRHIRSTTFGTTPTDSAYVVTPRVSFGIRELRFNRSRAGRGFSFFKTADTAANTTNWVFVARVPRVAGFPSTLCLDSAIMINDVNAKRIQIRFDGSGNSDIDSIALTSVNAIVPIKFSGISAQQSSGLVKVAWTIQTEINTLQYDIEKSTDGRNFVSVGSIAATNTGKYSWIDNTVSTNDSYYRIKGIDKDGAVTYSTIVRINSGKKLPELVIMPNPVQAGLLNIQMSNTEKGAYTLQLYNNNGALVFSSMLTNEGGTFSKSVALPSVVTKGVYQLQLTNGATRLAKAIIVQ